MPTRTRFFSALFGLLLAGAAPAAAQTLPVTSGLRMHLRADDLSLANGAAVTAWDDQTAANNTPTTGTGPAPTFRSNQVNGHAVVRFAGGNLVSPAIDLTTTSAVDLFIVARTGVGSGSQVMAETGANFNASDTDIAIAERDNSCPSCAGGLSANLRGDVGYSQATTATTFIGRFGALQATFNKTLTTREAQLRVDGALVPAVSGTHDFNNNNAFGNSPFFLGGRGTGPVAPYFGDIAEVIFYARSLSVTERAQVQAYLTARYAIAFQEVPVTSGLRLHLKADAGVTTSGGTVSAWADQSGNGFDVAATGSQQPAFAASAINGLPALTLDGNDDFLQSTAARDLLGGQQNYTFYAVTKAGATQKDFADIFDYSHSSFVNFVIQQDGGNDNSFSSNGLAPQPIPAGAPSIFSGTFINNGGATTRINGGSTLTQGSVGTNTFNVPATFRVGDFVGGSGRQFNGQIAEILIYNRVLTGDEQQQVEAYLADRYAITLAAAPFGNVVQLNGTTDLVASAGPAYTANDNFTLEAWVKPTTLPTAGFETIITNSFDDGTVGNGVALGIGSGTGGGGGSNLVVLFSGVSFFNTGISFPTAGLWYHVAVTRRSGTTLAYLDGVQAPNTSAVTPNALQTSGSNLSTFRIGSQNGLRFLHGQVDEARAWSVGRTQAEIQGAMGGEINGNTAGLAAYWRFNRSGQGAGLTVGNHATSTGAALSGTTVGTASTPVFVGSQTDNAVLFNGTTDGISIPTGAALTFGATSSFTVETLVKSTSNVGGMLFSQQRCTSGVVQLITGASGAVSFRVEDVNDNGGTITGSIINDGLWHHVAGVRDVAADQIRLFVDGVLVAQASDNTTGTITNASTENLLGQRFPCAQRDFYAGSLDEVRVWNVARTQAQLQARMNQSLTGNETGLALYYDMNRTGQGAGLTVTNGAAATGLAFDGTTVGTGTTPVFSLANNPGVVAAAPTISSFSPTSGAAGTSVTVNGNNFSGTIAIRFHGTAATTFNVVSATQATATVPAGATTGTISLTTSRSTGISAGTFTVTGAPRGLVTGAQGVRYDFNTAGQANDLSGNGRDGTLAGGATISGGVLTMGANASDVLFIPGAGFNNLQDFTVTATVRLATFNTGASAVNQLIMGTATGGNDFGVAYQKALNSWAITIDGVDAVFPFAATVNTTYQIVAARRGTQASFFVDGVQIGTTQTVSGAALGIAANGLVIGQDQDAVGGGFDPVQCWAGSVDEIAVYRSALTPLTVGAALTVPFTSTGPAFTAGNTYTVQLSNAAGSFAAPTVLGTVSGTGSGSLTTTVPSVPTGAGYRIRVLASNPVFTGDDGDQPIVITNNSTPTDLTFFPAAGSPGSVVLVTATGFTAASVVRFNGQVATGTTFNSATTLTATVPVGATTGPVTATTGATTRTGASFAVTTAPAPTLAAFSPSAAPVGATLTLTGTNFTGVTQVRFNGTTSTTFTVNSPTTITVAVPPGTVNGRVYVLAAGGLAQSARVLTVILPPTITAFAPTSGTPGALTVLTGTNFTNATGVTFGGVPATAFTVNSATQLTATVPVGALTGVLRITTVAGTATNAGPFTVTVPPPPTISGFSPVIGPVGTSVVITGTNLLGAAVRFNGTPATTVTVNSATQVTASVPAGATTGKLAVLTAGGLAQSAAAFTVAPVPTLTSVAPAAGSPGSVVLLGGTGLSGATSVTFGGVAAATFTVNSATQITVVVPVGALTGVVRVTTPGGIATSPAAFTVTLPTTPVITGFSPATGPVGTSVVITGSGFSGVTAVRFNTTNAPAFTVNSATQVTATVPAGATTGKLFVLASGGMAQSAAAFTVIMPPTITSLTPTSGTRGSVVVIKGTNLTAATGVTFGGAAATAFTVNSATQITATVPNTALTGVVTATTVAGTATSAGPFTITLPPPPTISGFAPAAGPVGSRVTLTGTNFVNVVRVLFNGVPAESYQVNSTTSLTATVPDGARTGRLAVVADGGMAQSSTDFTVTILPEITFFTPISGPTGTVVTVTGSGLAGTTAATVGGTAVVAFTLNSPTRLTLTVPAGAATGQLSLTTPVGTAFSAGSFTVTGGRAGGSGADEAAVTAEPDAIRRVLAYPNPAHTTVWVEGAAPGTPLLLFDPLGRLLRTTVVPVEGPASLDVQGLPTNVYTLRAGEVVRLLLVE